MNNSELRSRLLRRREELLGRAMRIQADQRRENDPLSPDFAEQATQVENDPVLDAIGQSTWRELRFIDAALQRIDTGAYAICARCGQAIESARLNAVPYTDWCSGCAH